MHPPSTHPNDAGAARTASTFGGATLPDLDACSSHAVQFYHSDTFLVSGMADYVAMGLRADEQVVVVLSEPHREEMLDRLTAAGIDADGVCRAAQLTVLDARTMLTRIMDDGGPDSARFHTVIGGVIGAAMQRGRGRPVRAYGEMVDLLWREGNPPAALALERLWNELLSLHPFSLVCAYAMDNFARECDAGAFDQVCREHGHVFPTERYARTDERGRLAEIARLQQRAAALEAEVDRRQALEARLREALTERDALLESERLARADAEGANQAKSIFLATMSHELRTPLNAIAGYVDLLESGVYGTLTPAQEAPLQRIQHSQRHLLTLINDVLNFARIEVGRIEYQRETISIPELLAQVEALVLPQFETRDIAHHFEPCACVIVADRNRVVQILLNLLSNALKFTASGGRVSISAHGVASAVEIVVRDTGCGIPPDQVKTIFDPFVQVGRRLSQPREGVGLGLAISRDLARGMGGDLTVMSDPGVGSAFTLSLATA